MPKFLESALRHEATKRGFTGRKADAYVYGAMNHLGAMHGNQETAKGKRMAAKHAKDVRAGVAESQREAHAYNFRAHTPPVKVPTVKKVTARRVKSPRNTTRVY